MEKSSLVDLIANKTLFIVAVASSFCELRGKRFSARSAAGFGGAREHFMKWSEVDRKLEWRIFIKFPQNHE